MIFRRRKRPLREIARIYAMQRDIPLDDWFGSCRVRRIAHQRQDCFLKMRRETSANLSAIGQVFKRDHTTVKYGIERAKAREQI